MGKKIILFLIAFLITFFLSEIVLMQRGYSIVYGAKSLRLFNNCEMVFIDKRLQPAYPVVLDCPGKDSIRLCPLPVVDPWVEDWWGRSKPTLENTGIEMRRRFIFSQDM